VYRPQASHFTPIMRFNPPDHHESSAGRENRIDRSETAKNLRLQGRLYKDKDKDKGPQDRAARAKGSSAELP